MTANQIAWFNAVEQQRSNYEHEREARRSNIARETETNRANVASETETNRANLQREKAAVESNRIALLTQQANERYQYNQTKINAAIANESARHNAVVERLNQQHADIEQFNAETARYNSAISELQAKASQLSASAAKQQANVAAYNAATNRARVESQNRSDIWQNQYTMSRTNLTNQQTLTESKKREQMKHEISQGWVSTGLNALRTGFGLLGNTR